MMQMRLPRATLFALLLALAACGSDDEGSGGLLDQDDGEEETVATIEISGPSAIPSGSSGEYTVRLLDAEGEGVRSTAITLATTLGTLSLESGATSATTNANGELDFTLSGVDEDGDLVDGIAELSASATVADEAVRDELEVTITPTVFAFSSPADGTNVALNARQTLRLRWTSDAINISAPVIFETDRGVLIDGDTIATTVTVDAVAGVAEIEVLATASGTATVTATDEGTQQLQAALELLFVGEPTTLEISAATPIRTGRTSLIEVVVLDEGGEPIEGIQVDFSLVTAAGGRLSPGTATTSATGTAYSSYTAGSSTGTAEVEISVDPLEAETVSIDIVN